ncbi:MAG: thrombospondin type 3 repeat-containing protein [Chitinophagaceae bacterium]|nr:thrombospondin type 3 repeat-containing protein [Chitinophagaceae bacterium]
MRKIDAILLSALIIYDYSAQSLVDSDAYSLGQALTSETNTSKEHSPANALFSELPEGENNTVRSIKHIYSLPASTTSENTITYHELAKINPVAVNHTVATVQPDAAQPETVLSGENIIEGENVIEEEDVIENAEAIAVTEAVPENAPVAEPIADETEANQSTVTYTIETVSIDKQAIAEDPASLDTDGDGIYDYEDKCQGIAGVARFEGCPVPDGDGDGVNDEEDRCPAEAGAIENSGCPLTVQQEIQPAAVEETATVVNSEVRNEKKDIKRFSNEVSLGFNGTVLTTEDFNIVLQFADILIRQQEVKVEVSAAKDNTNINYLVTYLKDLGVNTKQVVVSNKGNDMNADRDKVYMQLKF